jgi:hypothetical protein
VLLATGLLAVGDAAAECTYLVIPKKEETFTTGCCTPALTAASSASRFLPGSLLGEGAGPWVSAAYFGGNAFLVVVLVVATWGPHSQPGPVGLSLMQLGGLAVLGASSLFLVEVAAPTLLRLPFHHCPYDLLPRVPEAVAAVAFFLAGSFFLGWAGVARSLGHCTETAPFLPVTVRLLLRLSCWGYSMSLIMMSLELALA